MRIILTFFGIFFLINNLFSQREITGFARYEDFYIPFAIVEEVGTDNSVKTDENGRFNLKTTSDNCKIQARWIGVESEIIEVYSDTSLTIILYPYRIESHWLTVGTNYNFFNSGLGFLISNGYDENPMIHFEDFSQQWIYRLNGETNFNEDYSFGAKFAKKYLFRSIIYMPSIEFRLFDYSSSGFKYTDINFSTGINIKNFWGTVIFKTGSQNLNGNNNFGIAIGLQNSHYNPRLYYGLNIGYWSDYFTYNAYIQSFVYKHRLSIRLEYERIDRYDFLNVGLNYTFHRFKTTYNKQ